MKFIKTLTASVAFITLTPMAFAETIRLPVKTVTACLGKKTTVVQSSVQCNQIVIDGKTSRKSTFSVKGKRMKLIADVDEANLVAKCRKLGQERFSIEMEINNPNRTRYVYDLIIDCQYCEE